MQVIMGHEERLAALIDRARGGDRDAFDALASASRERLEAFVRSRIRPALRQRLDAAELAHETLSRAFESLARFDGADEDAWMAWLAGIAKRVVLKEVEKLQRAEPLRLDRDPSDGRPSPSRAARREERLDRLEEAIRGLPEDYREVIRLCRIEGLKIREAAERMGRSPDAVKKLLWRALKALKRRFGDTESLHLPARGPQSGGRDDA
jgi:RNA polymerase sigma-70 factor (ECF subfamily)